MRQIFLLPAILFLTLTDGQAQTPEPAGYPYPRGYTKTTKISTDENQSKITVVEIKDVTGQIRVRDTYTATTDGKFKLIEEKMNESTGHTREKVIIELDKDKKLQSQQCIFYPYGEESPRSVYERTPEGGLYPRGRDASKRSGDDDPSYSKPSQVKEWEKATRKNLKRLKKTVHPHQTRSNPPVDNNFRIIAEARGNYLQDIVFYPAIMVLVKKVFLSGSGSLLSIISVIILRWE